MVPKRSWISGFLLLLAMVLAVSLRTASFGNFINPDGGFYFYSIDSYDHLRRVTLGVHSFPAVPYFDYYAGFPKGTGQIWSPFYDYLLSAFAFFLGGSRTATETVCFFANPFFTLLTIPLLYFAAKKTFSSPIAGIFAAFFLAVSPGHISYTLPMNFDHHVLEPLAVLLLFILPFFEKNDKLPFRGKLVSAFFILLTIFMWRGSSLFWGIAFLSALIRSYLLENRKLSLDYAVTFAASSAVLAVICLLDPWQLASGISFGIISWFHVILLFLFSATLFAFGMTGTRKSFFAAVIALAAVSFVMLILPGVRTFFSQLADGLAFIRGAGDPWLSSISERKIVFSKNDFWYTASYLSLTWFAAPLALFIAMRKRLRGLSNNYYLINFIVWGPLLALGLILRYVHVAAIIASLCGGYLAALAWERWRDTPRRAGITVLAVLSLIPSYPHYESSLTTHILPVIRYGLFDEGGALNWIKKNTPKTSYYLTPYQQPEYGILTNWNLGAYIYQVAERPALATAFGSETHGLYEQTGFMSTSHPEIATEIVRENRVRYILLKAIKNLRDDFSIAVYGEKKGKVPVGTTDIFRPELSMYNRLVYYDGASYILEKRITPAVGNYRLVFETDLSTEIRNPLMIVSYYKVFEVVPGALITGKTKPGAEVSLKLNLITNTRRKLYYTDVTRSDKKGIYDFRVPYSTETVQGDTKPIGRYVISGSGPEEIHVGVTEAEVVRGLTINISERKNH